MLLVRLVLTIIVTMLSLSTSLKRLRSSLPNGVLGRSAVAVSAVSGQRMQRLSSVRDLGRGGRGSVLKMMMSDEDTLATSHLLVSGGKISEYWVHQLNRIERQVARDMIPKLDPVSEIGYSNAGSSMVQFCRQQKKLHPDKVIVIRCGDFYEGTCNGLWSLRGYSTIRLIYMLPFSGPLQSLDLTLSCISFFLAYHISIILTKSILYHPNSSLRCGCSDVRCSLRTQSYAWSKHRACRLSHSCHPKHFGWPHKCR